MVLFFSIGWILLCNQIYWVEEVIAAAMDVILWLHKKHPEDPGQDCIFEQELDIEAVHFLVVLNRDDIGPLPGG